METLSVLILLVFVIGSMATVGLSLKMKRIIAQLRGFKLVVLAQIANFGLVLDLAGSWGTGQRNISAAWVVAG